MVGAVFLGLCACGEPEPPKAPAEAEFVGEDVGRFWTAYDEGLTGGDWPGAFERSYKALGTSHLNALFDRRIGSASELAETVVRNRTYYESVRAETLSLALGGTWWTQAQAAFAELERIEPEAVFPPVAFVVGSMSSGGLTTQAGIVVELELFTRQASSPTTTLTPFELQSVRTSANLLPYVVHQLVHVQQTRLGSLRSSEGRTLLERALFEGIAELATEQLTGQVVGTAAAAYGMEHEAELWAEFQGVMNGTDVAGWLGGGAAGSTRPGDVGYFVGHRIAKAYAEGTGDWEAGFRELVRPIEANEVLAASGYAPQ
jgi:hypothetical protein